MSIFGSLMGDLEDDPVFGSHMNMVRQMNSMMNSMFSDPFGAIGFGDFEQQRNSNHHHQHHHHHHHHRIHNALMPFTMPMIPNFNRLLSGSLDSLGGANTNAHSYSSSTVVSMSSGPDGRPEVYKATSSTRTAPGGIKETQRTVTDSRTGTKKMAIGHHIGERAHIIEKEHNMHTGDQEERQDFINLEEEEADDFNREWETKTRSRSEIPRITASATRNRHNYGGSNPNLLAITGGPSSNRGRVRQATTMTSAVPPVLTSRRSIRASPLTMSSSSSVSSRTPYSTTVPGHHRKQKNIKTVSGPSSSTSSSSSPSQQEK